MITSTKYGRDMRFVGGVKVLKEGRLWFSSMHTDDTLKPFLLSYQPIRTSRGFKFEVPENYLTRYKFKA